MPAYRAQIQLVGIEGAGGRDTHGPERAKLEYQARAGSSLDWSQVLMSSGHTTGWK